MSTLLRFTLSLALCCGWNVGQPSSSAGQKNVASPSNKADGTYFVSCANDELTNRVTGPVSVYGRWRAYVEVSVQKGCLYTTRLWVAGSGSGFRLAYLMPPERENTANGMKILGWAPGSRMILVQTERSATGTDAGPTEAVMALDARTGEVYQPDLSVVLHDRKPRCAFHIARAGFDSDPNVVLLVQVSLFSSYEADETESDIPEKDRCTTEEETWSFNYANGEVKRVENSRLLTVAKR